MFVVLLYHYKPLFVLPNDPYFEDADTTPIIFSCFGSIDYDDDFVDGETGKRIRV